MTKKKLKWIIKRLSYIVKMLHDGKTEKYVYISKRKERIVIDDDVNAVIKIMDEIIAYEKTEWLKKFFIEIRKGYRDISIIPDSPMERTKYYQTKEKFINKIYVCCVYKGLVSYEDIMNENIC